MQKKITVKTSNGNKLYKVSESSGKHYCYKYASGIFGGWDSIGTARSLEDAISIIKVHASKFGRVLSLDIQ